MSNYDKDRKFYWLQLKEDFFEEDAINWLEDQDNGILYSHFYLKLCLKSLRNDGILIRTVGNILVPYDAKKLSEITNTDLDTVIVAMELLKKIGLVEVLESGEIYLTQIENMIGSKSIGAFKKQQQRQLRKEKENSNLLPSTSGGQMSAKCPPEIEIELEIENRYRNKDRDKKEELENLLSSSIVVPDTMNLLNLYEKLGFGTINEVTASDIEMLSDEYSNKWVEDAIREANDAGIRNMKYVRGILKNWMSKGRKENKNGKRSSKSSEDLGQQLRDEGIGFTVDDL